jgi:hypothetical protein
MSDGFSADEPFDILFVISITYMRITLLHGYHGYMTTV